MSGVSRSYTSAARRAAVPAVDDGERLVAWVDGDPGRARQALRELDARPVDPGDVDAVAVREHLVATLRAVYPSFELDGVTFRVEGALQLLDLCELMKLYQSGSKATTADVSRIGALADFFKGALGGAEYERFRDHLRDNATDEDTLTEIMFGVVEDLSDRPTERPSHFVGGPSSSGTTSRVVSLSPAGRVPVDLPPATPGPDLLAMSPEQFARWQAEHKARAAGPLGLGATPPPSPESLYFG